MYNQNYRQSGREGEHQKDLDRYLPFGLIIAARLIIQTKKDLIIVA